MVFETSRRPYSYLFWTRDADTAMARTASDNLENKDLRVS
jgi:hypothetical protein